LDTIQGNSPTAFHPDTEMVKLVLASH